MFKASSLRLAAAHCMAVTSAPGAEHGSHLVECSSLHATAVCIDTIPDQLASLGLQAVAAVCGVSCKLTWMCADINATHYPLW